MRRALTTVIAAVVVAALGGSVTGHADTIGFAAAIKILAASCGKDIEKYCKNVNLGNNQIQQCLQQNDAKVSATCKADYARVIASLQARFAAQAAVAQVCNRDAQALCKLVKPGSGHLLKCLLIAQPSVSPACNQAIDDAGYR